jgi:hypothetical protein
MHLANQANVANAADVCNVANAANGANGVLRQAAAFGAGGNDFACRLKSVNQVPHPKAQSPGDFHQIIHGRGFLPPFNPANKHRGEVGFLRQLLLAESRLFASGANCLTQKAAVLLNGEHHRPRSRNHEKPPCR